jgi:hypothetical protein
MDTERIAAKFKALTTKRHRAINYAQHLQRQEARSGRIARLLRVSPDEAKECMELTVEYLLSAGILKKGMVKLPRKRIQGDIDNDVKMFLVQNGLCD